MQTVNGNSSSSSKLAASHVIAGPKQHHIGPKLRPKRRHIMAHVATRPSPTVAPANKKAKPHTTPHGGADDLSRCGGDHRTMLRAGSRRLLADGICMCAEPNTADTP
uniref:Uncharacterized protein n=1 Tax=Arundo donax TaxID=35708 RepID=A0A0A9DT19_ARUDO